jgi:large subunit ribosomal protein L4
MPIVKVYNALGNEVSTLTLSDEIFGIEPSITALHAAVKNYLANQRQGTQSTLTRTEVRGGGRKPWRQKGTGHARQGSTRSPQWRHGGISHGPKPRTYGISVNKKVKRLALKSALSAKVLDEGVIVLNSLELSEVKTKPVAQILDTIGTGKKTLIVLPEKNDNIYLSARNIPGVKVALINTLNVYDIVNADSLLLLESAVSKLEEVYA